MYQLCPPLQPRNFPHTCSPGWGGQSIRLVLWASTVQSPSVGHTSSQSSSPTCACVLPIEPGFRTKHRPYGRVCCLVGCLAGCRLGGPGDSCLIRGDWLSDWPCRHRGTGGGDLPSPSPGAPVDVFWRSGRSRYSCVTPGVTGCVGLFPVVPVMTGVPVVTGLVSLSGVAWGCAWAGDGAWDGGAWAGDRGGAALAASGAALAATVLRPRRNEPLCRGICRGVLATLCATVPTLGASPSSTGASATFMLQAGGFVVVREVGESVWQDFGIHGGLAFGTGHRDRQCATHLVPKAPRE